MVKILKAKKITETSWSLNSSFIQWSIAIFISLWVLAIVKVFVLDERDPNLALIKEIEEATRALEMKRQPDEILFLNEELKTTNELSSGTIQVEKKLPQLNTVVANDKLIPKSSEWLFVNSAEDSGFRDKMNGKKSSSGSDKSNPQIETKGAVDNPKVTLITKEKPVSPKSRVVYIGSESNGDEKLANESSGIKKSSELVWPPVDDNGKIPDEDGWESMPLTNVRVPRFWSPQEGVDLNTIGTHENGEETIFLMLASYRDFQCRETITSAFLRADHPERLYVAAVDQVIDGDIGCLDIEIPCAEKPDQPICKYRSQIAVYTMNAEYATGPVTARHIGDRMYRGQYYSMQLDAHCLFVRHWDTTIIKQYKETKNEMAVLSTYLTDVQGSIDRNGDSTRHTRPIMCNSDFEGVMPARYLRHGSQPEDEPAIHGAPQLEPFWAAGFSFARGHFTVRVPYDAYQPMVFQGEEIAIGIRGFTFGYDYYAPHTSVVFHEYAERSNRRKKVHMFWENSNKHAGEGQKSLRRATSIIGMAPDIDKSTWSQAEIEKYGLGTVRTLEQFYSLFLINPKDRVAVQLCPFVKSGIMHRDFQPLLRPDGNGIDYSKLTNYDTKSKIDEQLRRQIPEAERLLREGIRTKRRADLNYAIFLADRVGIPVVNPTLYADAKAALEVSS